MLGDRFLPSYESDLVDYKPPASKRFNLLRSFSLVSLSAFVLATSVLSIFYRQREIRDLVTFTEENNVALTQVFANVIWPKYNYFLARTQGISDRKLAQTSTILQLNDEILAQFEGLSIAKVKIYDLEGRTVYSTDFEQIGNDKSESSGFIAARSGEVTSQLDHRDTFKALRTTLEDRHLLSSYIPIRANGKDEVVGVFELYADVTPLLLRISQTQREITAISLVILAALYGVLFLFVRRADRLLSLQYQQLQKSQSRYQQQADELQQTLDELHHTQGQMIQSEKMSSLGQLVAGVAHEINNPVNFIHGNLSYLQDCSEDLMAMVGLYQSQYPDPTSAIREQVEAIDVDFVREDLPKVIDSMKIGTGRIREIVLSLRNFSRLDESKVKSVDIHDGLDSTLIILNHRFKARPERPAIEVIKNYADLPPVKCYPGLLNQVFMNILANAIDALEETIEAQTPEARKEDLRQITLRTELVDQQWVRVAIADNGTGMPADVKAHIFDPFFTTKPTGKGTGMGMSISHQIVTENHRGKLHCFSEPGKGTEFVIQIPVQQTLI